MKRRLMIFLEETYGSAYSDGRREGNPASETSVTSQEASSSKAAAEGGAKGKKGKAGGGKKQSRSQTPPDGGRFDLRCGAARLDLDHHEGIDDFSLCFLSFSAVCCSSGNGAPET